MRIAVALFWFVAVVGAYFIWCVLWADDTISLSPVAWWWLPIVLLFVVPVALWRRGTAARDTAADDKDPAHTTEADRVLVHPGGNALPTWVWFFIFACCAEVLLSLLGVAAGFEQVRSLWEFAMLAGVAGVGGCVVVGRRRFRSVVAQAALCFAITLGAWLPALAAIVHGLGPR